MMDTEDILCPFCCQEEDELLASHYVSYKERALEKRIGLELKSNRDSRI